MNDKRVVTNHQNAERNNLKDLEKRNTEVKDDKNPMSKNGLGENIPSRNDFTG